MDEIYYFEKFELWFKIPQDAFIMLQDSNTK